jgi:hypothetical protein
MRSDELESRPIFGVPGPMMQTMLSLLMKNVPRLYRSAPAGAVLSQMVLASIT